MDREKPLVSKTLVAVAVAVGVAAGSYGIASAASDSGSSSSSATAPTVAAGPSMGQAAPDPQNPWGGQRSDETLLSGDTASKVEQAAKGAVSGGTIVRVETDADGHAAYEAHMTKADGTPATVYVNEQFEVVSVETR